VCYHFAIPLLLLKKLFAATTTAGGTATVVGQKTATIGVASPASTTPLNVTALQLTQRAPVSDFRNHILVRETCSIEELKIYLCALKH
jgi:hypothetical protein